MWGQRRDSQFPMLRHGAGVGRDRVSERTREADPLCFLGEWEFCQKHLLFRRNLHYRVDIWRGLTLRLLWRWFGSWAQLIGVALSEFLGVGKDSFSCEHTLASQTSFFERKKHWEDFPKRGRSSRPPSCVFPGCGYAPHSFGTSEPRCYFSFYFLVYLGLIWQIIKWLSSWILGWQAEKARAELACTFHLTYQCERVQHGEWAWTWARRLPGFRASLCHWLWPGDVTLCLCFLNRIVGITVEPPLQNCEDWMR